MAHRSQAALARLYEKVDLTPQTDTIEILLPDQFIKGELLNAGGQANVYLGKNKETGEAIIIKLLKSEKTRF